jgi:hypothetical protein
MSNVIPYPGEGRPGGGGPEDPMIDQRVSKLEDDMKEVKASLKSIELSVAEIKHLPKMSDFNVLRTDISDVKGRMGITEGKLAGIEGRLQHIPNTWQIIGILFGVAAVLYTASRVLR